MVSLFFHAWRYKVDEHVSTRMATESVIDDGVHFQPDLIGYLDGDAIDTCGEGTLTAPFKSLDQLNANMNTVPQNFTAMINGGTYHGDLVIQRCGVVNIVAVGPLRLQGDLIIENPVEGQPLYVNVFCSYGSLWQVDIRTSSGGQEIQVNRVILGQFLPQEVQLQNVQINQEVVMADTAQLHLAKVPRLSFSNCIVYGNQMLDREICLELRYHQSRCHGSIIGSRLTVLDQAEESTFYSRLIQVGRYRFVTRCQFHRGQLTFLMQVRPPAMFQQCQFTERCVIGGSKRESSSGNGSGGGSGGGSGAGSDGRPSRDTVFYCDGPTLAAFHAAGGFVYDVRTSVGPYLIPGCYENDAAAGRDGLQRGDVYMTSRGQLRVRLT